MESNPTLPQEPATPPTDEAAATAKKPASRWLIPGLLIVLLVLLILKPGVGTPVVDLDEATWRHDPGPAMTEAAAGDKPVLALFTADWCPPCQTLKGEVFQNASVVASLPARVMPVYVDMTNPARNTPEVDLAVKYGVQALPTALLLTPDGRMLGQFTGAVSAAEFTAWLDQGLGEAPAQVSRLGAGQDTARQDAASHDAASQRTAAKAGSY